MFFYSDWFKVLTHLNGPAILGSLAKVLLVAYLCYVVHMVVVYSLSVKTLGKLSPVEFFKGMMPAIMMAFFVSMPVRSTAKMAMPMNATKMALTMKHMVCPNFFFFVVSRMSPLFTCSPFK